MSGLTIPIEKFKLTKAQVDFLRCCDEEARFLGAISSGKTFVLVLQALIWSSQGEQVLFVMPTYGMIRKVIMPVLKKHLITLGITKKVTLTTSPPELLFGTGMVWFVTAESPDTMRGITASAGIMDECGYITDEAYKIFAGRIRGEGCQRKRFGGTPTGSLHWFSEMACKTLTQSVIANPFVSLAFKRSLIKKYGGLDNKWARQELLAEIVDMSGTEQLILNSTIYAGFNATPIHTGEIWLALDVARKGGDDSVIAVLNGNHITALHKRNGLEGQELRAWLVNVLMSTGARNCVIDTAGIGGLWFDDTKDQVKGVNFISFNGACSPSDKRMYANLRAESWDMFNHWLQRGGCLKDLDVLIVKEIASTNKMYEKGKLQLESKDKMTKSPDSGDAMVMVVWGRESQMSQQAIKEQQRALYDPDYEVL